MIEKLTAEGLLNNEGRKAALDYFDSRLRWTFWLNHVLLFLGTALVLSGIVFFFAFNWQKLTAFTKFAAIEAGLVICILLALKSGLDKPVGKVFAISAGLLVGVFLAVFGQVYQTGADSFEMFAGWTLLIAGWVVVSRSAAFWIMWLTILNIAVILYWEQLLGPARIAPESMLFLALAVIDTAMLALSEWGRKKQIQWLAPRWYRQLLWVSILTFLVIPSMIFIIDGGRLYILDFAAWILVMAAGYRYYRYYAPDLLSLTTWMLSLCAIILTGIGRVIFHKSNDDIAFLFLFFGLIVVGVFSGAAYLLRIIAKQIDRVNAGDPHDRA
ncbi:MAG: DUF2157 domain-containing protein [bacterium]|nr:DUF2157 domain-containing protein [bacterium]